MKYKLSIAAIAFLAAGFATEAEVASSEEIAPSASSSAVAAADTEWALVSPDQPDGPKLRLLTGNPREGAFSAILKVPAGYEFPLHSHPANKTGVVLSGSILNGRTTKDASLSVPGTLWVQPANEVHYTGCTADSDCIFIVHMDGALGIVPSEVAAEVSTMSVTTAEDISYSPVNPKNPKSPGKFVVSGDMSVGAFTALIKIPGGAAVPPHSHLANYSAAVISGSMSHGGTDTFSVGAHWTQIAEEVHTTACVSEEDCIFFVTMDGAFSIKLADSPAEEVLPAE